MSANNVAPLPSRTTASTLSGMAEPAANEPDPNAPPPFDPNALVQTVQSLAEQNQQTQQMMQQMQTANQQQNEMFGTMSTTMQTMSQRLAETHQEPAPNPAADPSLQLNDREREELGTSVDGINKLIDQRVLARQDELVNRAAQVNAPRIQSLEQTLQATQQQLDQANARLSETYQSQAYNTAAVHSIDLHTLDKNPEWNAFLGTTADPVTGVTYAQHLNGALDEQRPAMFSRLLSQFASTQAPATKRNGIPEATQPATTGARTQAVGGENQVEELQTKYHQVSAQARELTSARLRQQMSDLEYQKRSEPLQAQMFQIQSEIAQLTQPNT